MPVRFSSRACVDSLWLSFLLAVRCQHNPYVGGGGGGGGGGGTGLPSGSGSGGGSGGAGMYPAPPHSHGHSAGSPGHGQRSFTPQQQQYQQPHQQQQQQQQHSWDSQRPAFQPSGPAGRSMGPPGPMSSGAPLMTMTGVCTQETTRTVLPCPSPSPCPRLARWCSVSLLLMLESCYMVDMI